MRLICLSGGWTVVLCFLVWPVLQVGAAYLCLLLPDRCFCPDAFFYRTHAFEKKGKFYESVFHVSQWKHLLPDGGALWTKRGYRKRKLTDFSTDNLQRFLIESARAEISHWLGMAGFWVFWLFTPPFVPWLMLIYALAVNLPCIIVQRYNRPRIQRLLARRAGRADT